MTKKAYEEWLVQAVIYIALILVLIYIIYALMTGKFTSIFQGIMDKLRFF